MAANIFRLRFSKNALILRFESFLLALLVWQAPAAFAAPSEAYIKSAIKQCIRLEEQRRGLPPGLLLAIAKAESGLDWRAVNRNADGSYDIGVMQINSRHLPRLRQYGVTPENLWHPCINVSVGAFILHEFIAKHGLSWKAVAAYNTGAPERKPEAARRYAQRVYQHYVRIAMEGAAQ